MKSRTNLTKPIAQIANRRFPTTTVGSFPGTVAEAIEVQDLYGINYPTTGQPVFQTQGMAIPFLLAFNHLELQGSRLRPLTQEKIDDLSPDPTKIAKLEPIKEVATACEIIKQQKGGKYSEFIGLKAAITGPITLYSKLPLDKEPSSDQRLKLLTAINDSLVEIADQMFKAGALAVQFDEPHLTRGNLATFGLDNAFEILDDLLVRVGKHLPKGGFRSLHVCGYIKSQELLEDIVNLPVEVLDFEFAELELTLPKRGSHFDVISSSVIKGHNIAVGVVTNTIAEENIRFMIDKLFKAYPPDIILLKPDCGLRELPQEMAKEKIRLVSEAQKLALAELS